MYHDGAFKAAQLQSKFAPTYFYYFRFVTKTGIAPELNGISSRSRKEQKKSLDDNLGISHGDDVFLIYYNPDARGPTNVPYSKEEMLVGGHLIGLYHSFAKHNETRYANTTIEKVFPRRVKCLEIFSDENVTMAVKGDEFGNTKFWDSLNINDD